MKLLKTVVKNKYVTIEFYLIDVVKSSCTKHGRALVKIDHIYQGKRVEGEIPNRMHGGEWIKVSKNGRYVKINKEIIYID